MKRLLTRFRDNLKTKAYIMSKLFTPQKVHMFEELISDKSTIFDESQLSFASIFEASSYFLMIWDMSVILFSLFSLWMISFTLNFDIWEFRSSSMMLYFVIIVTICDGLVMNNRAIISEGEVIKNRRLIFRSYLYRYFPQETLYIIIWILYHMKIFTTTQGVSELIVIIQIYLLIRKINQKYSAYYEIIFASGNNGSADLFILVISIYIFNHLMACLWIYVALNSIDLGNTWILDRNLTDPWPIYNTAFYWASMTMTTVGYGDVVPKNNKELIAASAIMFISTCVFAYSMNSFGILLKNINDSKQEYKRNLVLMSTFMKNKEVQYGIQSRVRNYLKCVNDSKSQNLEEITRIISTLPINLKCELNQNIKMKAMAQITQIVTNFSLSTQTLLSEKLEQIDYSSGEVIQKSKDHDNLSLYYLIRGGVQLRESLSNKLIQSFNQGDHFGQYSFYTGFQQQYNIICSDACSIYKIDRQHFINIIKHNQNDFQKFHCIKDGLIFNNDFSLIDLNCVICTRATHEAINCPWISYKPDLEARIKKEYFIKQERRKVKRKSPKIQILTNFKKFNEDGNQFVLIHNQSVDIDHQGSIQGIITKNTLEYIQTHSLNQQSSVNLYQPAQKEPPLTRETTMLLQVIDSSQHKIKSQVLDTQIQQDLEYSSLDLQFHYCVIDQLCSYIIYLPNNNIEAVINSINRKFKSKYYVSNKYSFQPIKKAGQQINNFKQYRASTMINRPELQAERRQSRKK